MTVAMFAAAGKGRRIGADKNKVLLNLSGKPILVHTLQKFAKCKAIDEFIIITGKNDIDEVNEILKTENLPKTIVVEGGAERQYSVENGLKALPENADIVLIHDAVRPFVSLKTIEKVITAAKEHGAAIAAVPEKNTIKVVENGIIKSTPSRENIWVATTPQGFRRDILVNAYKKAREDNFFGTDDASLVERLGTEVHIVEDTYENFKITTKSDLKMAEYLIVPLKNSDQS